MTKNACFTANGFLFITDEKGYSSMFRIDDISAVLRLGEGKLIVLLNSKERVDIEVNGVVDLLAAVATELRTYISVRSG